MLTSVVGINWGDEGKGRMVDLLSAEYDVVCRYQGGSNAGHTVVNDRGKFVLNLLPVGILRDEPVNLMGNGMVIDIEHLFGEIDGLLEKGVKVSPNNLKISDKAFLCLPIHKLQDIIEEDRLADKKYGSTRRGIAPAYGDKYMKKGLQIFDIIDSNTLEEKLKDIVDWKNLSLSGYGNYSPVDYKEMFDTLMKYRERLLPFVTNSSEFLKSAVKDGKNIMFEAQLGALRDVDYGIYPMTTSSNTIASYAPIGAGLPGAKIDRTIGVMKAFSSCVGEGPFCCELFGEEAAFLRETAGEYGAATGRPRRVGGFDAVASRYGVEVQGADELAVTKLDILAYMDKIPVCVAYEIDGKRTECFPSGDRLLRAKPVYEYLEGFKTDISTCRKVEDLPNNALKYVRYLEKTVNCPVKYLSVGPSRDDYLTLP